MTITLFLLLAVFVGFIVWANTRSRSSDPSAPISPPAAPAPPFEPSCLAKGIVKAWIDDPASWKITSKVVKVPSVSSAGGWYASSYQQTVLINTKLGIRIQGSETSTWYTGASAFINDSCVVHETYSKDSDSAYLCRTITAHPYPRLKKVIDKVKKDEATRAARIKAIETLGCPS